MSMKYFVVINEAAWKGRIVEKDMDDIWTPQNEDGWTYQEVLRPFGSLYDECDTREEAEKKLKEILSK